MPLKTKPLKAYIRGAYGPGNLGDDVLLEVCINVLRPHFNEENISIGIKHPKDVGYLSKFKCKYVPISAPIATDFLFFGGGGQFFEFSGQKTKKTFLQKYHHVKKQGISHFDIIKIFVLRALNKNAPSYKKSAAMCLGIGPFETTPSDQIEQKIRPFLDCSFKSVRDNESLSIVEDMNHASAIYTDPTFLLSHWFEEDSRKNDKPKKTIGIILRDWTLNQHGANILKNTIDAAYKLLSEGHAVKLISLYYEYDKKIIDNNPDFEWIIWNPKTGTPSSFISGLKQEFGILISTRAHGVLLPAHIGLPSVVIGIEPKLKNIHNLLPNGTLYSNGLSSDEIVEKTLNGLNNQNELSQQLLMDIEKQTSIANTFLKDINSWITKNIQELP